MSGINALNNTSINEVHLMAANPNLQGNQLGVFLPTTNVWDPSDLYDVDVNSPEFKQLLVRLYQNLNTMALAVNAKESSTYPLYEFVTGQQYFPNPSGTVDQTQIFRDVFRTTVNCGMLPNTGSITIPHGIMVTVNTTFTHIYGAATDPVNLLGLPLPYASPTLANNISVDVDATNVTITTGSNRTAYTIAIVVIEYMQT
jgi:hypothetical protein